MSDPESYTVTVSHTKLGVGEEIRLFLADKGNVETVIEYCLAHGLAMMVQKGMQRGRGVNREEQRRASMLFAAAKTYKANKLDV